MTFLSKVNIRELAMLVRELARLVMEGLEDIKGKNLRITELCRMVSVFCVCALI